MRRRETSVWMIMCGSSSISTPNQERRNWWESFLFLEKYKKTFYASQIVRSRSRKRERIITEEKASHPSWSSAITRKYGVAPKPFLVRPQCPPFPPLSPQIHCLPARQVVHSYHITVPHTPNLMNSARYHRVFQNLVVPWKIHMSQKLILPADASWQDASNGIWVA